jgi:ribosomal protein S27AE
MHDEMSEELFAQLTKACPDCGGPPDYADGPHGGLSVNIFCHRCGQGYNVAPLMRLAQRIHNRNEDDNPTRH